MRTPHLIVIGGGYAGIMAAATARHGEVRVTVVDTTGRHGFLPRLATVAAGVGPGEDADVAISDLLPDVEVVVGTVSEVDHRGRWIALADGRELAYDALVVAAGAQASPPPITGLADHAWTLRSPADALALRERIASTEALVIVGAGSTGTQLAGEVSARWPRTSVVLAEMADGILPNLPRALGRRATQVLADRGVTILTGVQLKEVAPHGAVFADGIEAPGLVVWAGGFASDASAVLPDAALTDGRVVVDRCAQVAGHGPLFAAGDIAAHRGPGGKVLPQTAQVAVRAGKLAGLNALRATDGRRPRPTTLRHIGWVLPLGGGQAVGQVGPLALADPLTSRFAPLMHDAIDLRHLLTVGGLPAALRHHQDFISIP